jgi:2-polyprenyl-3-methyl-5-hydroxy-6-metoxy-1,4-benzoquinol methylase
MSSAQINRPCPLCQSGRKQFLFSKGTLRTVACQDCDMIFADPVEASLASGDFYDQLGDSFYLSPEKLAADYAPVRFERELRIFRRHCQSGRVLDVGCSTGAFLFQLKTRFPEEYETVGTDVTSAALDHAEKQGVTVVRESFLAHPWPERGFDAVCFWAVLEHLLEPAAFLRRAASLLKPGGHCFVLVPNMRSLAVRLLGARYRYIMPDHINYFTAATLCRLGALEPMFERVEQTSTHFNPVVIAQDFRRRTDRVADHERARLLGRTTAWKQSRLLAPLQWLYRGSEHVLRWGGLADNLVLVLRRRAG